MANANKPSGLVPVMYLNGSPWNGKGRMYCIPSTDNNAFAIGDPLVIAGSADDAGVPTVTLATGGTGNQVLGALISGAGAPAYGQQYGVPAESPIVIPATKARNYYVMVSDDPNIIYEIQEDNDGSDLAAVDTGLNCNLISGTNNGYISGWQLDSSSKASGATLQVRLLGLAQYTGSPGNVFGTDAKWWVLINNHCYRVGQAGL